MSESESESEGWWGGGGRRQQRNTSTESTSGRMVLPPTSPLSLCAAAAALWRPPAKASRCRPPPRPRREVRAKPRRPVVRNESKARDASRARARERPQPWSSGDAALALPPPEKLRFTAAPKFFSAGATRRCVARRRSAAEPPCRGREIIHLRRCSDAGAVTSACLRGDALSARRSPSSAALEHRQSAPAQTSSAQPPVLRSDDVL